MIFWQYFEQCILQLKKLDKIVMMVYFVHLEIKSAKCLEENCYCYKINITQSPLTAQASQKSPPFLEYTRE